MTDADLATLTALRALVNDHLAGRPAGTRAHGLLDEIQIAMSAQHAGDLEAELARLKRAHTSTLDAAKAEAVRPWREALQAAVAALDHRRPDRTGCECATCAALAQAAALGVTPKEET